jgi:SH3-like domain-containing protein
MKKIILSILFSIVITCFLGVICTSKLSAAGTEMKVVALQSFDLWSKPAFQGEHIGIAKSGEEFVVICKEDVWYSVMTNDGDICWVHEKWVSISPEVLKRVKEKENCEYKKIIGSAYAKTSFAIWSNLTSENEVVANATSGEKFTVLAKQKHWYKVKTKDNIIGWVDESWISLDPQTIEALEKEKQEHKTKRITKIEDRLKHVPASNYKENLKLYNKLIQIDPTNKKYKEKVKYYSSKLRDKERSGIPSCYDLGYRYGKCGTKSMKGLPCDPENDIIIPARCRGKKETQRGMDAGVRSVY